MKSIDKFFGEYRFLSNFWFAETTYEGLTYPTSEHAYQAAKSNDQAVRKAFQKLPTPGLAKSAGAALPWNNDFNKLQVMYDVVKNKFSKEPMRSKLLSTGDAELIEGNSWGDVFWGVCRGVGENNLGKILMRVRNEIKEKEVS